MRHCTGPPGPEPVFHPALPPEVALPLCPMRVAQEAEVARLVTLFARCDRYRTLPARGGLWAQPARVMAAFDVMRETLRHSAPTREDSTRG